VEGGWRGGSGTNWQLTGVKKMMCTYLNAYLLVLIHKSLENTNYAI
jgi:hypothetical protein